MGNGTRKFGKLDSLLREEILCTCYAAFLGKDRVAECAYSANMDVSFGGTWCNTLKFTT